MVKRSVVFFSKSLFFVPLLLGLLLLSGCMNIGGNVRGTGEMVTRNIEVADFTSIEVGGNFRIIYRQGAEAALTVVMQENLFTHLDTSVRNGNLRVRSRRGFDTTSANRPRLYVYTPNLASVNFSGAVSASDWDMVQGQNFTIDVSGAASLDLRVDVTQLDINASGAVNLDLEMDVDRLNMDVSGAARIGLSGAANNININGSGAFNLRAGGLHIEGGRVDISGAANVYLSTLDNVSVNVSGLARVREAE